MLVGVEGPQLLHVAGISDSFCFFRVRVINFYFHCDLTVFISSNNPSGTSGSQSVEVLGDNLILSIEINAKEFESPHSRRRGENLIKDESLVVIHVDVDDLAVILEVRPLPQSEGEAKVMEQVLVQFPGRHSSRELHTVISPGSLRPD